ncbi:hypothetical protein JQC91_12270 [Jannaschia sp. Os4]|uniref:hypothetical protein n=1 Tax=Jannaschia sp. Os4 TaxID=2807617 RepID=UPI001939AFE4|nr:hypothetical protein [Jannaschia sp. Os4]MBM2577074.1 hypothetical protein [Jannaschia sp. Os4]
MRGLAAAALALALPVAPAAADVPVLTHTPPIAQVTRPFDAPPPGEGRVRMVRHGGETALLSLDQAYRYERAYDRALTRAAFRMPVHRAEAHARAAAWHAVTAGRPREASGLVVLKRR